MLADALTSLTSEHGRRIGESTDVPSVPGLYAVHAQPTVWVKLQLGEPSDGRPLYVGKSESSLVSRDVRTHFSTGKTGSSTLRRSLAALLRHDLDLIAVPRNLAKPSRFANFSLAADGDERLTAWMLTNLHLAVWAAPAGTVLLPVERGVLGELLPPLNIKDVRTEWREQVISARRALATEAASFLDAPS